MKKFLFSIILLSICFQIKSQISVIDTIIVSTDERYVGRGNTNEVFMRLGIWCNDGIDLLPMTNLLVQLQGTFTLADIADITLYSTQSDSTLDSRTMANATLLNSCNPTDEVINWNIPTTQLHSGVNYLWITCSIHLNAEEGNAISLRLNNISLLEEEYIFENLTATREILLARKLLYAPGDYNSTHYRIPAIITAKDGSLVIATDKRKHNQNDLPEDIDILINRSTDNGQTWSTPYTLAQGTGTYQGFGDAALSHSNDSAGLICVFVGGPGLAQSTPANPIRSYMCRSLDNGITWSQPVDITHFIFGSQCQDPVRKYWRASFFGSGNGLLTSTGRIMFVAAIRQVTNGGLNNYVVYSDDNGASWNVSQKASTGGDEAKVTELTDGRILMSIRHGGNRWYNISQDGGITWQNSTSSWSDLQGPACNGDMIRYTSVNQGYERNRLLHSLPNSTVRENVSVYLSYDEGDSWAIHKSISPYGSAYSSLTILPDGTIGAYIEENYNTSNYSLYYVNFSLEWLTDGDDNYQFPTDIETSEQLGHPSSFFTLSPNPAQNQVVVNGENIDTIFVYSIDGKLLTTFHVNNQSTYTIDVSNWESGNYIFSGFIKGKKYSKVLVISK